MATSASVMTYNLSRHSLASASQALLSKSQVSVESSSSSFFAGEKCLKVNLIKTYRKQTSSVCVKAQAQTEFSEDATEERFRLHNIAPQPGSRRPRNRKGRGIAAGQGASCGFGMRGQKSRSGPGVRPGFEGGQKPLYRRLPKLKGIAGGMGAGLPKHVAVNLADIALSGVEEGEEISLETLIAKGIINPTGRDRRLPLKILGDGEVEIKFTVKAAAFSKSALEKLEAAGCTVEVVPGRKKFLGNTATKKANRMQEFLAKKDAAAAGSTD